MHLNLWKPFILLPSVFTPTKLPVKCTLKKGMVEVSGGGLGYVYSTLQFHFHWGSTSHDSEGSEHAVDSHRYNMEVVISTETLCFSRQGILLQKDFALCVLHFFNFLLVQMHIVNKRKDLKLDEAVETSDGLAVLAFFIEVKLAH